ncbi:MAG: VanZ family protein [Lachnospiraceae bacterium]|nr:VanZ family protein [Lachnospiraceae bacterium]
MGKRSVSISSLIILLALLSFLFEVCLYYFIKEHFVTVLVAIVLSVVLTHYFLEKTMGYDGCFLQGAFVTICSAAFVVVIYLLQPNPWMEYDYWALVLVLANWLVPFIYCFIRDFCDHGPRYDGYLFFFYGMSAVFLMIYALMFIKQQFITPLLPPYEVMKFGAHNFVPFMATGHYFEAALSEGKDVSVMVLYIVQMVAFAVPYGFYVRVFTKEFPVILRILLYLCGPFLVEVVQAVTEIGRGDIDDYAFSIVGLAIGVGIFRLVDHVSYYANKRNFLEDRTVVKNLLFHI